MWTKNERQGKVGRISRKADAIVRVGKAVKT